MNRLISPLAAAGLLLALATCTLAHPSIACADPPTSIPDRTTPSPPPASPRVVPSDDGIVRAPDPGPGIRFEDLPNDLGLPVRIVTRNRRVHLGVVEDADARHLTLSVKRDGGSASYVLKRAQIERIDPA